MNDTLTFASARHPSARPGTAAGPAAVSRQPCGRASLRSIVAIWRWRMRYRRELEQRSKDAPHLIEDIGLTVRQVEAEIAKRFWQV